MRKMLDVDLEQFWRDDDLAHRDNCFAEDSPQVALGIRMSGECVFAELGEEGQPWGHTPRERRIELNCRYNDKAEQIVGRRLLPETFPTKEERLPAIRPIGEVFGGRYVFTGESTWLEPSCSTPQELEEMLDTVDRIDLRQFILPNNWEEEKLRLFEAYGKRPNLWRAVRGPVTLAMSIYGVENLIFLILDQPDLAKRFSQAISDVICGYAEIMDEEAGFMPNQAPGGFQFNDDDCSLLNAEMYQQFGLPILQRVFARWCPKPTDRRYQHSDSDMAHLLPLLAKVNLTGCNFGPTVLVDTIREHMPGVRIDGCLAPFTFMNNAHDEILREVKRDCEMARHTGRGLNLSTAGSINNGSLLTSMRTVMYGIQTFGRY